MDLPAEQHESLRSQLMAQVDRFSRGPKMVLTRLCVALGSLILHTLLDSWTTAVPDLLRAFQDSEGSAEASVRRQALLEVLAVLPEELQTRKLSAERRAQLQNALAREWSSLCPLLRQILRREDSAGQVNMCLKYYCQAQIKVDPSTDSNQSVTIYSQFRIIVPKNQQWGPNRVQTKQKWRGKNQS